MEYPDFPGWALIDVEGGKAYRAPIRFELLGQWHEGECIVLAAEALASDDPQAFLNARIDERITEMHDAAVS